MSKDKEMPEKADLKSLDISVENRAKLKQLFPSVFTETKDEKGELVETIDFEKLKAELGTFSDVFKKDCMKLIQKPSIATLKPCREESVSFDETENLFIEGDNLEILKLLQKSYYGKIKMIYIDPPYNTGKEFIYPDDYSESLDTYLAYAGLIDDEGKKFSTNTPNEGRFHTKWLNMMYPRLYLARNLLSEKGVVFISIDDSELCQLKKMCDELFGEESFCACISRVTGTPTGGGNNSFVNELDYVLVYSKGHNPHIEGLPMSAEDMRTYDQEDDKGKYLTRPLRRTGGEDRREDRPTMFYPVTSPDGEDIYPYGTTGYESRWRCSREKYNELHEQGLIEWRKVRKGDSETWQVYQKFYLEGRQKLPSNHWDNIEGNKKATIDLKVLFEDHKIFDFPKPVELVQRMAQIVANEEGDIILDFFAGSATTAHSVLDLNSRDFKQRSFILVQLPEPCGDDSEAAKAGYKTIAEIGKERIRRVITKIEREQGENAKKAKGDLLKSVEEQPKLDLGFKVLKLDKSNFKIWDGSEPEPTDEKLAKQLEAFVEHVDPKATQEDILFELLLKAGFKPTEKIEKKEFAGKIVFSIAEGLLLICLEDEITKELIEAIAEAEPLQFICLDRGFKGNDQLKANAVQTFAARNQGRDKQDQIVFRTV